MKSYQRSLRTGRQNYAEKLPWEARPHSRLHGSLHQFEKSSRPGPRPDVLKISQIFSSCRLPSPSSNFLKFSQIFSKFLKISQNFSKSLKIPRAFFRTLAKSLEMFCGGQSQISSNFLKLPQISSNSLKISENLSKFLEICLAATLKISRTFSKSLEISRGNSFEISRPDHPTRGHYLGSKFFMGRGPMAFTTPFSEGRGIHSLAFPRCSSDGHG